MTFQDLLDTYRDLHYAIKNEKDHLKLDDLSRKKAMMLSCVVLMIPTSSDCVDYL